MSQQQKSKRRSISIEQLLNDYRHHPYMLRVTRLQARLKQEKQEDKIFYQSLKEKIASAE